MDAKKLIKHIETKCKARLKELDHERKMLLQAVPSLALEEKPKRTVWTKARRQAQSEKLKEFHKKKR